MPLPKFEDFKAPWEVDKDGKPIPVEDQKPDPAVLKKHLYNVLSDKEKAQTARDTALGEVTTLNGKVTELEKAAADRGAEGLSEIQKLQKSIEDLTKRSEQAELEKNRLQVMTDKKLKPEAAEFLTGKTVAELNASADKLVALGLVVETTDGEKQVDEKGNPVVTQPEVKHRVNSGDPKGKDDKELPSREEFLKQYNEQHVGVFGV